MPTTRIIANEARTTLVCVDSYTNGTLQGHLVNNQLSAPISFDSLMQFFLAMEDLLDKQDFPQAYTMSRSFRPINAPAAPISEEAPAIGQLATFAVKIIFRQHASWQGTVVWLENNREENFRSALELAILFNSALTENVAD